MTNIPLFDQKQILKKYSNLSDSSLGDISWSSDDEFGIVTRNSTVSATTNALPSVDELLLDEEFLSEISSQYIHSIVNNHNLNATETKTHQEEDITFDFLKDDEELEKELGDMPIATSIIESSKVLSSSEDESDLLNMSMQELSKQISSSLDTQIHNLSPLLSDSENSLLLDRLVDDIFSFEETSKPPKSNTQKGIRKPIKMKILRQPEVIILRNDSRPVAESIKQNTIPSYFTAFWNHGRQPSNNQLLNF